MEGGRRREASAVSDFVAPAVGFLESGRERESEADCQHGHGNQGRAWLADIAVDIVPYAATDCTLPIPFMRLAGLYLLEYRGLGRARGVRGSDGSS